MPRPPRKPLYAWPPQLACCVKWAQYAMKNSTAPTPPRMTAVEALANLYEELIDGMNYCAIAQSNGVDIPDLYDRLTTIANEVRDWLNTRQPAPMEAEGE